MREHFYHSTTRNYIIAFASLFDGLQCRTGAGNLTPVPLHYAPKSKFLEMLDADYDKDETDIEMVLPRMAFELQGLNYAPERHLNPMNQLAQGNPDLRVFNRIAYDFSFALYVVTKEFDDSLEIAEQIIPMFSPDFTVAVIEDVSGIKFPSNISVVLNSSSFNIDYEGSFTERRRIEWTLNFTLKGYLYPRVTTAQRIKKAFVDVFARSNEQDILDFTARAWVNPEEAGPEDPHEIVEDVK